MTVTRDLIYNELEVATTIVKSACVDFEEPIVADVKISQARSFWGQIKNLGSGRFELKVSNVFNEITDEQRAENRLRGMLVHELLHTIKGCMNHGSKWKAAAAEVNRLYPELNVKRTTSMYEYGITKKINDVKYEIRCRACGNTFYRQRKTIHTDPVYLNHFCKCGRCNSAGRFEVVEL